MLQEIYEFVGYLVIITSILVVVSTYLLFKVRHVTQYVKATQVSKDDVDLHWCVVERFRWFSSKEYLGKYAKIDGCIFKAVPTNDYKVEAYRYNFDSEL